LAAAAAFIGFGYFLVRTQPEPHFTRRNYPHDGLLEELGVDASDEVMVEKRGARA
jgi:NADH dehydrogenase (ubiquinone) 1 beta subcomplex subunit 8